VAYELLEDPVVLFNRGECYRRTGDADKAVADYRAFLDKVPQARNRADIEAKSRGARATAGAARARAGAVPACTRRPPSPSRPRPRRRPSAR
jgi:hypothetical protein